jgi:predicted nucleotidyltransferase
MPVRSLSSSVFKWPDVRDVEQALQRWIETNANARPEVLRVGVIGSYARNDWSMGSDLDLIVILKDCGQPFYQRANEWDATLLPVPADLLICTEAEWLEMKKWGGRFAGTVAREAVWLYEKNEKK